ncbi:MAG: dTDP-4-dehydrorhamnose reductase [Polaribacter sp.]|uniref:dTDP-4-dehydrorhamnose reductase n=1 Tax=Polaribacter sp. TaxID=1920175 RepID=UPI002F35D25C
MNVLVTGANGLLGSEIKSLTDHFTNLKFFFKGSSDLNICNLKELDVFFNSNKIDSIINCAAYTAVDKAEEDILNAKKVNEEGVLNLVNISKKINAKLIHISTDYVFNGESFIPYKEIDGVSPIGVYGNTKREGELSVLNSDVDGLVIRTSWLYSSYGNNFVKTMLRLGENRDELSVIFDQVGSPTYARDLALACLNILDNSEENKISSNGKMYHFSNEGVASWYDFAKAIMFIGDVKCNVKPIETKDYPTPAKRPHFSVLNKTKIKNDFGIEIPYWRDSLTDCISKLKNK